MDEKQVAADVQQFAEKHNLKLLTPNTPESWAKLVIKHQGCPCVPSRHKCPCDDALEDVGRQNSCRCHLFVNEAYLRVYNELVGRQKSERRRKLPD